MVSSPYSTAVFTIVGCIHTGAFNVLLDPVKPRQTVIVAAEKDDSTTTSESFVETYPFVRFPRTEHLYDTGAATRDDKIYLGDGFIGSVVVEEKIDGANVGLRVVNGELQTQNRGAYLDRELGSLVQFSRLSEWIRVHKKSLVTILGSERFILYGEWCEARHSIEYARLPGYFIAFDLFDIEHQKFLSRLRFREILNGSGIPMAPTICTVEIPQGKKGRPSLKDQIDPLLETPSSFRSDGGPVEGVVLRQDDDQWLIRRLKVVRSDFIQACAEEHWSKRKVDRQTIDYEFSAQYLDDHSHDTRATQNVDKDDKQKKRENKAMQKKQSLIPRCIMLMGLPGSGKSSFAQQLQEGLNRPSVVANQDTLGRKKCKIVAATRGRIVILDRCNLREQERCDWVEIMGCPKSSQIVLVQFTASVQECIERVQKRVGHASISSDGGRIVREAAASIDQISEHERAKVFGKVETVETYADSKKLLLKWGIVDGKDDN